MFPHNEHFALLFSNVEAECVKAYSTMRGVSLDLFRLEQRGPVRELASQVHTQGYRTSDSRENLLESESKSERQCTSPSLSHRGGENSREYIGLNILLTRTDTRFSYNTVLRMNALLNAVIQR